MRQRTIDLLLGHEKLIAHIANSFSLTTEFDASELISYGRSVLIKEAHKWEPSRGKFSTFLYWCLRSAFTDYIHKQRKEVFVDVYEDTTPAPESYSAIPSALTDMLDNLSDDGRALVDVCLASKWTETWQDLPRLLKEHMLRLGWEEQRFSLAFVEVQSFVRTW